MPRYQCSTRKCTLEVGLGEAATCPVDGKALVDSPASTTPASGCYYSKEAFLARTFKIPHYTPSTGRGKFDCVYAPNSGDFQITIRFGAEFNGGWNWFGGSEKEALRRDFTEGVPPYWNGKFVLRCTKPGWTDITVRPRFGITFGDTVGAHFRMVITREDARAASQSSGRECRGFVSIDQVTSSNPNVQDRIELRDFQMREFNHSVGGLQTAGNDREFVELAIGAAGITTRRETLGIDTGGRVEDRRATVGVLDFPNDSADPAALRVLLQAFITRVKTQMAGSHPVPIFIKGFAKTTEADYVRLSRNRAEAVRAILAAGAMPNPVQVKDPGTGESRVEIWLDHDYEWSFKRGERDFDYNVAAHEFGHLLGLPDEYENPVAGTDAGANAKAKVKTNYLALVGRASQRPPVFPSHTSSIMSDGMTTMPWHFVTVWEALVLMTESYIAEDQWAIMAAS